MILDDWKYAKGSWKNTFLLRMGGRESRDSSFGLEIRRSSLLETNREDQLPHKGYADGRDRALFTAGLKARAGHATTWRADSFMKQPAINPESMTNPNTAAIKVSPKRREVMTATLMMMIFFILFSPFWCASYLLCA